MPWSVGDTLIIGHNFLPYSCVALVNINRMQANYLLVFFTSVGAGGANQSSTALINY